MRKVVMLLSAFTLAVPATVAFPVGKAEARETRYSQRHYRKARRCRHSSGTTGLVAGGVGGALVGRSVIGGGLLGTAAGAVGGALAGRAIDRTITAKKRCRY